MNWDRVEGNWKEFKGKANRNGVSSQTTIWTSSKANAQSFLGVCSSDMGTRRTRLSANTIRG